MIENTKYNGLPRRAITLVEILITVAIIAMIISALYMIVTGMLHTVNVGDWQSRNQIKMRISMKKLHMDLFAATYPSMITLEKTEIFKDSKWSLSYKDGKTDFTTTGDTKLLEFFISTPGRDTPEEKCDKKIVKVTLKSKRNGKDTSLILQKELVEGPKSEIIEDSKTLVLAYNVRYFDVKLLGGEQAKALSEITLDQITGVLKIEIHSVHPTYENTFVTEVVEIPLHVQANKM